MSRQTRDALVEAFDRRNARQAEMLRRMHAAGGAK